MQRPNYCKVLWRYSPQIARDQSCFGALVAPILRIVYDNRYLCLEGCNLRCWITCSSRKFVLLRQKAVVMSVLWRYSLMGHHTLLSLYRACWMKCQSFFCHEHDAVDKDSYATWTTFSWRLIKEKYKDRLNGTPFVIKIPRFSLSIYKLQFWCNYILTAFLCSSIIRLGCTNTFVPIYFVQHALDCPFLVGGRDVIKQAPFLGLFGHLFINIINHKHRLVNPLLMLLLYTFGIS